MLGFFTVSVVVYATKHGVHGFGFGDFSPTYAMFIAAVPVLFFNFAGLEVPSAAGEEMTNPRRDVPFAVLWSGLATVLAYGIPILGILIVLPRSQVFGLTGFIDAARAVFTVYGGHVASNGTVILTGAGKVLGDAVAITFIWAIASAGATWIMGSEAIAAADGGGPRFLGYFSKRLGTPIAVNLLSGLVATVLMVLAFTLTGGNANRYFEAVLGLTISTTTLSYMFIFPAFVRLRYKYAEVERPYRVPGGAAIAWALSVLTTLWALLATVALIWPGFGVDWFGQHANPNDALAALSFSHERLQYELSQIVPLIVLVAVGLVFYGAGRRTRLQSVAVPLEPGAAPVGGDIVEAPLETGSTGTQL